MTERNHFSRLVREREARTAPHGAARTSDLHTPGVCACVHTAGPDGLWAPGWPHMVTLRVVPALRISVSIDSDVPESPLGGKAAWR